MQSISIVKQSTTPLKSFISKREFLSLTPIQSILEFFLIPKEIFYLYIYKVNNFFFFQQILKELITFFLHINFFIFLIWLEFSFIEQNFRKRRGSVALSPL